MLTFLVEATTKSVGHASCDGRMEEHMDPVGRIPTAQAGGLEMDVRWFKWMH